MANVVGVCLGFGAGYLFGEGYHWIGVLVGAVGLVIVLKTD